MAETTPPNLIEYKDGRTVQNDRRPTVKVPVNEYGVAVVDIVFLPMGDRQVRIATVESDRDQRAADGDIEPQTARQSTVDWSDPAVSALLRTPATDGEPLYDLLQRAALVFAETKGLIPALSEMQQANVTRTGEAVETGPEKPARS